MLTIHNEGPLIVDSDYWRSEMAADGALYLSVNAGAFRLLIPESYRHEIPEMKRGAKHVVVSMLSKDKWVPGKFCVEWMVDDGSNDPWACQLSPGQFDRVPSDSSVGVEWTATVWESDNGRARKALELPAFFQIVPSLPWLRPIDR